MLIMKIQNKLAAGFDSTSSILKNNAASLKSVVMLLFFSLIGTSISAQWLKELRANTYNSLTVQYWKALEIVEVATYYSDKGKEEVKTETTFSVDRRQVSQTVYRDDERVASYVYQFNPWKQLMNKTIRELQTDGSWQYTKQQYTYQGKLLRTIDCFDVVNSPLYSVRIENDSLGLPIKAVQLSADSTVLSSEKAVANYTTNRITYIGYDAQGNVTRTEEGKIGFKKVGWEKVNLHGDCYFYPLNRASNDSIYCNLDIKYDSNGNWVEKKIYQGVVNKSWELDNPTLVCVLKRKIKYVR